MIELATMTYAAVPYLERIAARLAPPNAKDDRL